MFSPIGAPDNSQQDINWLDDLKFFIDNEDKILSTHFFPAIKRHKEHKGNPHVFKVYIRPIENALDQYCNKFEITDREEKFPKEKLIDLAKLFAEEQEKHISKGSYD